MSHYHLPCLYLNNLLQYLHENLLIKLIAILHVTLDGSTFLLLDP